MRLLCVILGYLCGCFLTAEIVARYKAGQSASKLGSKNPGTANIAKLFGVKWAAVTLFGDIVKTILPCMVCRYVLFPSLGQISILYTGLGAALGHGFPFWNKFHGGKSVAVTCTYLFLCSPLWGGIIEIAGLCIVILTGYLTIGALAIPCLYLIPASFTGLEAGLVVLLGMALLIFLHRTSIRMIMHKEEKKVDLLAKLKNK